MASAEVEYSKWGGVPQQYHEKSHGESFLKLVQNNFQGQGIYLLDEPEAALSPQKPKVSVTLVDDADNKKCVSVEDD